MNSQLHLPFDSSFPEDFDGILDSKNATITCSFNQFGTLLAVGCSDGNIVIWDFVTRSIAKTYLAHVLPVTSIAWSHMGDLLLSGSLDNTVSVWNIVSNGRHDYHCFPMPVLKVQFQPHNNSEVYLVTLSNHAPVLITIKKHYQLVPVDEDEPNMKIVATFDCTGKYIVSGNGKGKVMVVATETLDVVASFQIMSSVYKSTCVLGIEFTRQGGDFMLINGSDRQLRLYSFQNVLNCCAGGKPEQTSSFQDLVNKLGWKYCCFSRDGEYICACSNHEIYIWERFTGTLVKILQGHKNEEVQEIVWHPTKSTIACVSAGAVSIWIHEKIPDQWGAYFPTFMKLVENVEYEERESEFDLDDEDKSVTAPLENSDEEENDVDIMNIRANGALHYICSDDEPHDQATNDFLAANSCIV